jgi:hypothetical protein
MLEEKEEKRGEKLQSLHHKELLDATQKENHGGPRRELGASIGLWENPNSILCDFFFSFPFLRVKYSRVLCCGR